MKKLLSSRCRLLPLACLLFAVALASSCASSSAPAVAKAPRAPGPLAQHGRLSVKDRVLVDEHGQAVQLRGFSTHKFTGLDWLYTPDYLDEMVNDWGMSVLRLALYTEPGQGGYIARTEGEVNLYQRKIIETIVEDAEAAGLYVIIDWHILGDGNPTKYQAQSAEFFRYFSEKYRDKKNILYEICNEPNGSAVTWEAVIRPYAEAITGIIRQNDPQAVVLVGSSNWSQDVDQTAKHPLEFDNVLYTFHFYAGSHGVELRDKIEAASKTIGLFCSEWGTTDSSGHGKTYPAEVDQWMKFVDSHGWSWCNWSLSTTAEGSAALVTYFSIDSGRLSDNLTDSGKLAIGLLQAGVKKD